ncbi:hypothetical protein MLD38_004681 [Melastoma candidum]|uniref:Uncharacterized protein n=1 Tax=Melastoma candidum TaxID=119954 RepID=A0ACB9SAD6_9MYRT|nr:hypothetical protein MLD38_004681 [Melastoma candidum]
MRSSSGASSGSSASRGGNADERKRKRMISNRESARRSRMRKRKRVDDLALEAGQLAVENRRIVAGLVMTKGLYVNVEAENSVLRAQVAELSSRLDSLNGIIAYVNSMNVLCGRTQGNGSNGGLWEPMMADVGPFVEMF